MWSCNIADFSKKMDMGPVWQFYALAFSHFDNFILFNFNSRPFYTWEILYLDFLYFGNFILGNFMLGDSILGKFILCNFMLRDFILWQFFTSAMIILAIPVKTI